MREKREGLERTVLMMRGTSLRRPSPGEAMVKTSVSDKGKEGLDWLQAEEEALLKLAPYKRSDSVRSG